MTTDQMRAEIERAYQGPKWLLRVRGMDDRQVTAVYLNMKRTGRLEKQQKKKRKRFGRPVCHMNEQCEQITIFDLLKESNDDGASIT